MLYIEKLKVTNKYVPDGHSSATMNPFTIFTLSGPALGGLGWYFDLPWLFWVGAALAGVNLFMNLASGAMKVPILPFIAMIAGAVIFDSWLDGCAVGILAYTAVEGILEFGPKRER
mgnify:CR=1 FL=1